jgi:hypothetical protein
MKGQQSEIVVFSQPADHCVAHQSMAGVVSPPLINQPQSEAAYYYHECC